MVRVQPDRVFLGCTLPGIFNANNAAQITDFGGPLPTARPAPETVDEYIARCPPNVRSRLDRIRRIIRRAAPEAVEKISYTIPTFTLNGVLLYFAAFANHIGLYPPVRGDARIEKAIATYAGPKGNLRFPLDEPMPYHLIERIVKLRVKQNRAKTSGRKTTRGR